MIITVLEHFDTIAKAESQKPEAQRRSIPSQTEFARAAGVTRQAFHKWLKNPTLNESYLDAIITKMRAYGFDTNITDLVRYEPPK
ncbi:MAG: hypothetical protein FOGNACKC_02223 [Anaerolineae bacterium]|nr:hypothetical protein [Anaerolineae bacterium]